MEKYLSYEGLAHFWAKLKESFALKDHAHDAASASQAGFQSAQDKDKLDGIPAPTAADAGKYLCVGSDGKYALKALPAAEEVKF